MENIKIEKSQSVKIEKIQSVIQGSARLILMI